MASCSCSAVWRFIFFFQLHDYLLCLIFGFVALGVSKVRPHCRPFSWNDPTISFPYAGAGTFPSWTLPIISVVPAVVYVLGEAARHCWAKRMNGGILAHKPFTEQTWLFLEKRRRFGEAALPGGAQRSCFDVAAPPVASLHVTRSPLSESAQRRIEVLVTEMPSALKAGAQDLQNDSPVSPVVPPQNLLTSSLPPSANTRDGLSGSCGAPAAGPTPCSYTGDSVPPKQRVCIYTLAHPWQRFLFHAHMWVLLQAFSITVSMLVVSAVKVYAGRPRPDFLSRLRREGFTPASADVDFCAVPKDGRVSFPSGHSGISFAAFVPFCFYVLHSLHAFRLSGVSLWRIAISLVPLILPITVAVSRTRDNRHFFDDIIAGSAIGIASALIAVKVVMVVNDRTGQLTPRFPYCE